VMKSPSAEQWTVHTRHTLHRYDEALLRHVAHKLCKPRNQWPVHELLDRVTAALDNAAMLDRRLKELPIESRRLLAAIGRSRQPRWPLGSLVELVVALGAEDGLAPIMALLESGLLLPELFPPGTDPEAHKNGRSRLKSFDTWLGRSEPMPILLASPIVTQRVLHESLGIEGAEVEAPANANVHEADGLDWPLRIAVLWQQVLDSPLRRTQQGDFFKRDHDRLKSDPLLSAPPTEAIAPIPDPGFFTTALASSLGLLHNVESESRATEWQANWTNALPPVLLDLWTALLRISKWSPAAGHAPEETANPYPSAYLLAMLCLAQLPANSWAAAHAVEKWVIEHHPYWRSQKSAASGIAIFLLGIAYSMRLLQATKGGKDWLVRLSPLGRWMLRLTEKPPALPGFKQTLLMQPNLEILAYRQGLTPELIAGLSKFATWKTLGAACTLLLEPHSVYRALEMGESYASIVQLLEGHGMKALPGAVLDSLRTWSSKRERISIYSAGAIFEFGSPAEMNDAIARGLPALRLTDKLAIVANEKDIEYKHFRLTGTRDYTLPPERCVDVAPDGVTLSVDLSRSDLLLDTELQRFAEPLGPPSASGRSQYRITPASILAARQQGVTLSYLETWFAQRTGLPITAAALLLMSGPDAAPVEVRRQIVVHLANEHLADGLAQWPGTRELVVARLGPTALVVEEAALDALSEKLKELGVQVSIATS
jgi:hypothetical protein